VGSVKRSAVMFNVVLGGGGNLLGIRTKSIDSTEQRIYALQGLCALLLGLALQWGEGGNR
jgi:hypothetical protein